MFKPNPLSAAIACFAAAGNDEADEVVGTAVLDEGVAAKSRDLVLLNLEVLRMSDKGCY